VKSATAGRLTSLFKGEGVCFAIEKLFSDFIPGNGLTGHSSVPADAPTTSLFEQGCNQPIKMDFTFPPYSVPIQK
jgi:hypothetical protein